MKLVAPKKKPNKLAVTSNLYETAWFELYNKSHKQVQGMIDKAKNDESYYPREVKAFVRAVIELAQERETPTKK